ncbi:MAG TPA: response regulator, partial [Kofleriaceae bacterium]|nr:response regulator [Kofleriaceae bacterium]
VVEAGGGLAAIGADRLLGAASVVLRPLPAAAPADPVVAGASFDTDGNPQLVLDPAALVARVRSLRAPAPVAAPGRRRILVVDDSLTTRMLEQSILESAGYDVELAVSGEDGLEALQRGGHALMLVDVEMPGIDGFTVVERLRADPALRHLPAILVTSRSAPEDLARGRAVGASGYLVKSAFDQAELLGLIARLLEGTP